LNAPRWVSSFLCFSPAVNFLRSLIRRSTCCQFIFCVCKRNRLLLADQSLVDFVDVHFFLYFIFFCYEISVVATALQDWFGVLHKRIQLCGTPDVCVLSLRSGMVVTWVLNRAQLPRLSICSEQKTNGSLWEEVCRHIIVLQNVVCEWMEHITVCVHYGRVVVVVYFYYYYGG
jgi:hypothetical protein